MFQFLDILGQKDWIDFSLGLLAAALVWFFGFPARDRKSHD
jgi:hypothetical protein